jgi:trehalose 6-phosphate synthase
MALLPFLRRPSAPQLVLLSNREPLEHRIGPDGLPEPSAPAGGVTAALEPAMMAAGGTWIAWGSGPADFQVTDPEGRILLPPEQPAYLLRRVPLSEEEVRRYYLEISNRSLWPLFHMQLTNFRFDAEAWKTYVAVNRRFANAALEEIQDRRANVWVQDYHLGLVARMLGRRKNLFVHQFWHIPWPPPDVYHALPAARQLLRGLLGNDLLGLHTVRHVNNFLTCVADLIPQADTDIKRGTVRYRGHKTTVRAYPISIDVKTVTRLADRVDVHEQARRFRRHTTPKGGQLMLGVDRADYTKGIPHRLEAFMVLLNEHQELRGKVSLVQIAVPSRTGISEYQYLEREIEGLVTGINERHATDEWKPVTLIRENLDLKTLVAWYRAADHCIVSAVADGMNLVAKEFVASHRGRLGVLLLSQFAGAAEELQGALLINPYDTVSLARSFLVALTMKPAEREVRLAQMRSQVENNSVHDWMAAIVADVRKLRGKR